MSEEKFLQKILKINVLQFFDDFDIIGVLYCGLKILFKSTTKLSINI